jgi:hypothetical protein
VPTARPINAALDTDLVALGGSINLDDVCNCGHSRRAHYAATGALGSFGGSACEACWTCPTFRRDDRRTATADLRARLNLELAAILRHARRLIARP